MYSGGYEIQGKIYEGIYFPFARFYITLGIYHYKLLKEQYKHYSHSSAALMLNLPLNFGSVDQGSSLSLALLP